MKNDCTLGPKLVSSGAGRLARASMSVPELGTAARPVAWITSESQRRALQWHVVRHIRWHGSVRRALRHAL